MIIVFGLRLVVAEQKVLSQLTVYPFGILPVWCEGDWGCLSFFATCCLYDACISILVCKHVHKAAQQYSTLRTCDPLNRSSVYLWPSVTGCKWRRCEWSDGPCSYFTYLSSFQWQEALKSLSSIFTKEAQTREKSEKLLFFFLFLYFFP